MNIIYIVIIIFQAFLIFYLTRKKDNGTLFLTDNSIELRINLTQEELSKKGYVILKVTT